MDNRKRFVMVLAGMAISAFCLCACGAQESNSGNEIAGVEELEEEVSVELNLPDAPAGDFEYTDDGNGGIRIVHYSGSKKEVGIPAKIEGKQVTEIGTEAFRYAENVESVAIPEGVILLDETVFFCCKNLKTVKLPESLEVIGRSAFNGCEKLTNIQIPGGVREIGESAFCGAGIKRRPSETALTPAVSALLRSICRGVWSISALLLFRAVKGWNRSFFPLI